MKFTFKTIKPTGKWKSFSKSHVEIKLKGQQVGTIHEGGDIRFMIIKADIMEDKNPNCPWRWITLKFAGTTFDQAKEFVSTNEEAIQKKYNLHKQEKD